MHCGDKGVRTGLHSLTRWHDLHPLHTLTLPCGNSGADFASRVTLPTKKWRKVVLSFHGVVPDHTGHAPNCVTCHPGAGGRAAARTGPRTAAASWGPPPRCASCWGSAPCPRRQRRPAAHRTRAIPNGHEPEIDAMPHMHDVCKYACICANIQFAYTHAYLKICMHIQHIKCL